MVKSSEQLTNLQLNRALYHTATPHEDILEHCILIREGRKTNAPSIRGLTYLPKLVSLGERLIRRVFKFIWWAIRPPADRIVRN